jgi:hypothetical protein
MTTNYVTRFNSGGTPVDTSAPIFDNNGLVGVGVTTGLAEKLEVNGNIKLSAPGTGRV